MPYDNPIDLFRLPLSAYTPGQGDRSMEGGWETATGAPMYPFEHYLAGKAPYVTGATSNKSLLGQTVMRKVGDQLVPVHLTDYGPAVKGIDIASVNPLWAKKFPHQGQRDTPPTLADDRKDLLKDIDNTIYGGGQAPAPTPTPTPTPPTKGYLADGQPYVPGGSTQIPTTWTNYPGVGQVPNAVAANQPSSDAGIYAGYAGRMLGQSLQRSGQSQQQQALSRMSQAIAEVPTSNPLLEQLANDPEAFLRAIQAPGRGFSGFQPFG